MYQQRFRYNLIPEKNVIPQRGVFIPRCGLFIRRRGINKPQRQTNSSPCEITIYTAIKFNCPYCAFNLSGRPKNKTGGYQIDKKKNYPQVIIPDYLSVVRIKFLFPTGQNPPLFSQQTSGIKIQSWFSGWNRSPY